MGEQQAPKGLSRYVGVKEVCEALGISKPTLDRMRRDGRFPPHEQLSPNRVGWRVEVVEAHLAKQARSVASLGVTDPDQLGADELENQARDLIARALSKRSGKSIGSSDLSLQLSHPITEDEFIELETREHEIRAKYLAELPRDQAAIVAVTLMPQLLPLLRASADDNLRGILSDPKQNRAQFKLLSDALRLFELTTRLAFHGLRPRPGATVLEHLSEFDLERAAIVSAWLFPVLRAHFSVDDGGNGSLLFDDPARLADLAIAALNDDEWLELEARERAHDRA